MKTTLTLCLVACVLLTVSVMGALGEDGFKTSLSAGVGLTDGNSETLQANVGILTEGEREGCGTIRAGAEGNYAENTVANVDNTTVENARAFAELRKTLSDMTFAYVIASVLYDDIARVDYRVTVGPGLGMYLVKNDETSILVEAGVAYVSEDVANVTDDYMALRFAERIDRALRADAKVWQAAEFLPSADDFDDYLINAELGAEAAMSERLSLRTVLQNKYDSLPAAGLEKNDLSLIAGISVKL